MTAFHKTNSVYQTAERASFITHRISHSLFREFSFRLQNLIRELGEEIEVSEWRNFIRRLKRYRFEQHAAPLGFGNPVIMSADDLEELANILRRLHSTSPNFAAQAETVFSLLKDLVSGNENPILDKLTEIVGEAENLPIVINESRLIIPCEDVFDAANLAEKFSILSESQLRRNINLAQIACVGASRWYSDYVFTAPRAEKIHLLRFDWLQDKLKSRAVFISSVKSANAPEMPEQNGIDTKPQTAAEYCLESADIIPVVNPIEIAESFSRGANNFRENEQTIEARLFLLEGRRGVFLEENSRALVIDLDYEPPVRKRRVAEIASGAFIVLSDRGGGDLIVPLADKILGKKAEKLRDFQIGWKRILHNLVRENGVNQTISQLKNLGSRSANKTNLRNWMSESESNIDTRYKEDFAALMKIVGWEDKLEGCFANAKKLRQAHQKAGNELRRMIIRMIAETDLSRLEKYGRMEFELTEASRKLVALRVVSRIEKRVEIAAAQLNKRFPLEQD